MFRHRVIATLALVLAACACAPQAHARMQLDRWKGHVAFGYGKVFSDSLAPGGSISAAGGLEYPVASRWHLGPTLAFNLLGSSSATRGSVHAGLDYSLFDIALMATYLPAHGRLTRLSFGPGFASAHADLAVSAGGAGFRDLAVAEGRPELAVDAAFMPRRMQVVAIGAELGARIVPVRQGVWSVLTGRLVIHF